MTSLRSALITLAGLALAVSFVPALASAQAYNSTNCGGTYWYSNSTNNCTPGTLIVYVQALNQNGGYSYYNYGLNQNTAGNAQPSNFTVSISGLNASPSSFPGSVSGTQVSVLGNYSVIAAQLAGYSPTYSTGCNGTVVNNQQATCVITENNSYNNYSPYPTPYQYLYPYNTPALSCTPSYQTVNLGTQVTFIAQGGGASQYNWTTPFNQYLNIGSTLNVVLPSTGTQTVTVMNNGQTATCTVNVVASGAPAYVAPTNYPPTYNTTYPSAPSVYVTPTYVPRLPNTGVAPQNGAELTFAIVALLAAAFLSFPYVRKAFAVVLG